MSDSSSRPTRRQVLIRAAAWLAAAPAAAILHAQPDQRPPLRTFEVKARKYEYAPGRLEVDQDDLVKITLTSEDIAHSFTIDEYRIAKRVPGGQSVTFEFRADRPGRFPIYCNLRADERCREMRGELVVHPR